MSDVEQTQTESQIKLDINKAPKTCFIYALTKREPNTNIKSCVISLDGLLDYDYEEDRWEPTFEVSVFAENFFEMLQRDFGNIILRTLENYVSITRNVLSQQRMISPAKSDKKRSRDNNETTTENVKKFKNDSVCVLFCLLFSLSLSFILSLVSLSHTHTSTLSLPLST